MGNVLLRLEPGVEKELWWSTYGGRQHWYVLAGDARDVEVSLETAMAWLDEARGILDWNLQCVTVHPARP